MKLVQSDQKLKRSSGQCLDITAKGNRCSRDAVEKGFCRQHYKLRVEKGLISEAIGNSPIQEMPEVPESLGQLGRQHFQIYAQHLIDQDRLFQIYVHVISELCYLEEKLEETKVDIEKYGGINMYDRGPQISGYSTRYKDLMRDIRNLRKDLGLTSASEIAANRNTDEQEGQSGNSYRDKKAKNWK
jgi:phage terminase small subunit